MKARAGTVALVGRANVGKSSLLNRLLGEKVSIVSPVAQTTRLLVRGVLTAARGQIVFVDSPGIHKAPSPLGRALNRLSRLATDGADAAVLVIDGGERLRDEDEGWMLKLARQDVPWLVAVNKSDVGGFSAGACRGLWERAAAAVGEGARAPVAWVEVSAETGAGCPELAERVFDMLPEGEALFPADVLTDLPRQLAVADIVREAFYRHLHDELPHAMAVQVDRLTENGREWEIDALVYVDKPSQKGIVIGDKGRLIRRVTRASQKELSAVFDCRATLRLWVKVEPNWASNIWMLKRLGYV
jgi:GTP-binding protein Era